MSSLPPRADLEQLRRVAKERLRLARAGDAEAVAAIRRVSDTLNLSASQLSLAREHGFASWPNLVSEVTRRHTLDTGGDALRRLIDGHPELATLDLANWSDHPLGASPLGYVAMLRYDTNRGVWRAVEGTAEAARVLIAAGAPVDGRPDESETPLITAASYGDAAVARVLIEAGADLERRAAANAGGVPGGTALTHAAVFGMTAVVDVLASAGATVGSIEEAAAAGDLTAWLTETTDDQAMIRALVMAADHQRLDAIDALVTAGTPVDSTDRVFGRHPLRLAAFNGRPASVSRLLALGADPLLADPRSRRTPLDECREGRRRVEDSTAHDHVEILLSTAAGAG